MVHCLEKPAIGRELRSNFHARQSESDAAGSQRRANFATADRTGIPALRLGQLRLPADIRSAFITVIFFRLIQSSPCLQVQRLPSFHVMFTFAQPPTCRIPKSTALHTFRLPILKSDYRRQRLLLALDLKRSSKSICPSSTGGDSSRNQVTNSMTEYCSGGVIHRWICSLEDVDHLKHMPFAHRLFFPSSVLTIWFGIFSFWLSELF